MTSNFNYPATMVDLTVMEIPSKVIELLQPLARAGIPTYILFDGINPVAWIRLENQLSAVPSGEEVDVILLSGGGYANESYKMIRSFRQKFTNVNVIVPFWAKSAATLFAFGATKIVFHRRGELGPIDAQIKKDNEKTIEGETASALVAQSSLAQIEKRSREGVVEMYTQLRSKEGPAEIVKIGRRQLADMLFDYSAKFYAPLIEKIDPTEMGHMARTLDIGTMYARRILRQYTNTPEAAIEKLLYFLVYECPDHSYVVDYDALSVFLPFVIKSDQAPFDQTYDEALNQLSLYALENDWPTINSFLDKLTQPNNTDTITNDENNDQDNQPTPEDGGHGGQPDENGNQEGLEPTQQ